MLTCRIDVLHLDHGMSKASEERNPKPCECELAGYCNRHSVKKSKHWHRLCQTHVAYRAAWDRGDGPGQTEKLAARVERRAKVVAAREKTDRLIGWLTFLRQPQDDGVGDTANRLKMLASNPSDVHTAIKRLMSQCSCQPVDAIARLNREWPYS
jgi:hypothetical protein